MHDILLFADEKQLTSRYDLKTVIQAAGEAEANVSLTLIRGGKETTVVVTPEQRKATAFNQVQGFPDGWDLDFPEDDAFQQRMREQMDRMRNRIRRFER